MIVETKKISFFSSQFLQSKCRYCTVQRFVCVCGGGGMWSLGYCMVLFVHRGPNIYSEQLRFFDTPNQLKPLSSHHLSHHLSSLHVHMDLALHLSPSPHLFSATQYLFMSHHKFIPPQAYSRFWIFVPFALPKVVKISLH